MKRESLRLWMAGNRRVIVALGPGVDVPGIRLVVHLGRPEKITDFVQESGRGGRAGEPTESAIVISQQELFNLRNGRTARRR